MTKEPRRKITALKVHQWLPEWEEVKFDDGNGRREPPREFYLFSLNARDLKALSGIQRRAKSIQGGADMGIQRNHDIERSREIGRFVRNGFPWSDLSEPKRSSSNFDELKKPGWLPTSLVVNILTAKDSRRGLTVAPSDRLAVVSTDETTASITFPDSFHGEKWVPTGLFPIEVIDGQHRLWAFDDPAIKEPFELPVVAFVGLDISWQAYLFWTINIKPKRINTSLAFDLYPLLRSEDWLEKFEGHSIYRETRSQELVERLWSSSISPWYKRINMLGDPGTGLLSQASWVRSLLATYVRSFEGKGVRIGGLFGAPTGQDRLVLSWSRSQQAAFLIFIWQQMKEAVDQTDQKWPESLREIRDLIELDPAFAGDFTLLSQDQGVRGFLHVTNDICFVEYERLSLTKWYHEDAGHEEKVSQSLVDSLAKQPVGRFIHGACKVLAEFDWRTANAPKITEEERQQKLVFRGSGGYKELRRQLLTHLVRYQDKVADAAGKVLDIIR